MPIGTRQNFMSIGGTTNRSQVAPSTELSEIETLIISWFMSAEERQHQQSGEMMNDIIGTDMATARRSSNSIHGGTEP